MLLKTSKYRKKGSDIIRQKMRDNAKNNPNYGMKGKKHSVETKEKIRRNTLGKKISEKTKEKIRKNAKINPFFGFKNRSHSNESNEKNRQAHLGKKLSEETKKKISRGNIRKKRSKEAIEKYRQANLGKKNPNYGVKTSDETKRKLSKALTGKMRGDKHPNWKGGIAHKPYSVDWTKTLKKSIRERDKYTCKLCGAAQGDITFDVHHIDYDRNNCDPRNLILLCKSCHMKTNFNRKKWIKLFNIT